MLKCHVVELFFSVHSSTFTREVLLGPLSSCVHDAYQQRQRRSSFILPPEAEAGRGRCVTQLWPYCLGVSLA